MKCSISIAQELVRMLILRPHPCPSHRPAPSHTTELETLDVGLAVWPPDGGEPLASPGSRDAHPSDASGKEPTCQGRKDKFDAWIGKIPWRRKWQPTPVSAWIIPWTEKPSGLYSQWDCRVESWLKQLSTHAGYVWVLNTFKICIWSQ